MIGITVLHTALPKKRIEAPYTAAPRYKMSDHITMKFEAVRSVAENRSTYAEISRELRRQNSLNPQVFPHG